MIILHDELEDNADIMKNESLLGITDTKRNSSWVMEILRLNVEKAFLSSRIMQTTAEDNILFDLHNSLYCTKAKSNNF